MNSAGKAEAQLAIQFITDLQQQCDTETYSKFMNLLAEYYKQGNGAGEGAVSREILDLLSGYPEFAERFKSHYSPVIAE